MLVRYVWMSGLGRRLWVNFQEVQQVHSRNPFVRQLPLMKVKEVVEVSGRRSWAIAAEVVQSLPMSPNAQEKRCGGVHSFAKRQMLCAVRRACQLHEISLDSRRCTMQSVVA